ncbi:hypothetical protein KHC17_15030 [Agrobacterium salinitolerans]|uniref:hypothetical protein n=1 Tax=Agrobacterium salinitolerans TaxID=1183413 RepID=UPI001C24C03C|nr:hypothetical protein [Agrobacterium salinitolerans]QXC51786.1 hypothetical protein KHC17_15030 [Agrobacterium salinitolerans]
MAKKPAVMAMIVALIVPVLVMERLRRFGFVQTLTRHRARMFHRDDAAQVTQSAL